MKINLYVILMLIFTAASYSQEQRILLDESYSDWTDSELIYTDAIGDQNSGNIDFGKLWYKNDERFLFFRIEVGDEINLQDLNKITLYIDSDLNSSTGFSVHGIGAELEYTFGERDGAVRLNGSTVNIDHEDIGLISSPTVTSKEFEFAINRNSTFSGQSLFPQNNFKVVFADNDPGQDKLPNETGGIELNMPDYYYEPLPEYSISKTDESFIRTVSYNVERDGFFNAAKMPAFQRILQAVKPEIIGFQEIYQNSSQQTANRVEQILPSTTGQQWYHDKVGPDIIAVSRYPITGSIEIERNGAFLIDLRPAYDTDLLFIVAHPPCCDNNTSRQYEIDAFMAYVRDAKSGGTNLPISENTPIIIVGDMNLVGFAQQQTTLLTGDIVNESTFGPDFDPDWDNTPLEDSKPFATGMPMTFTWYDEGSSFSPGRLDYIVYSGSVLELKNSYTLFTRALVADTLAAYNLLSNDTPFASDHQPVVADFELKDLTGVDQSMIIEDFRLFQNYPNPFNPNTNINYVIPSGVEGLITLKIYDLLGSEVSVLVNEPKQPGSYEVEFNGENLPSGIYFYELTAGDNYSESKKMMLMK